jgi:hypothetical protein
MKEADIDNLKIEQIVSRITYVFNVSTQQYIFFEAADARYKGIDLNRHYCFEMVSNPKQIMRIDREFLIQDITSIRKSGLQISKVWYLDVKQPNS